MTIKTITFQQTFPTGLYANQKLGIEIDVSDCSRSTIDEMYQYAMDKVNSAFKAINPSLPIQEETAPISRELPVVDRRKETLKDIIADCTTPEELEKVKSDAEKYGVIDLWLSRLEYIVLIIGAENKLIKNV
jgi:hypothetical protein